MSTAVQKMGLTTWEGFWYVIQCIAFGAGYFAKLPTKKALEDYGFLRMTSGERIWYFLECIPFGVGYFAKVPVAKALSEVQQRPVAYQPGFLGQASTQAALGAVSASKSGQDSPISN